jgi:hypothetical protein
MLSALSSVVNYALLWQVGHTALPLLINLQRKGAEEVCSSALAQYLSVPVTPNLAHSHYIHIPGSVGYNRTDWVVFDRRSDDQPDINQSSVAIGANLNLVDRFVVSSNLPVALNDGGLREKVIPLIGLSYMFERY